MILDKLDWTEKILMTKFTMTYCLRDLQSLFFLLLHYSKAFNKVELIWSRFAPARTDIALSFVVLHFLSLPPWFTGMRRGEFLSLNDSDRLFWFKLQTPVIKIDAKFCRIHCYILVVTACVFKERCAYTGFGKASHFVLHYLKKKKDKWGTWTRFRTTKIIKNLGNLTGKEAFLNLL